MNVLILLIGGNPLPNYIIAKYLLKSEREDVQDLPEPDKILFIYSEKTNRLKKRIARELGIEKNREKVRYISLGTNQRDPIAIVTRIQQALDRLVEEEQKTLTSIHLVYTGGTKAMSAYSMMTVNYYWLRAVYDWIARKKTQENEMRFLLSDIDPDPERNCIVLLTKTPQEDVRKELRLDIEQSVKTYPTQDLRKEVELSVTSLLKLHRMTIEDEGEGTEQKAIPVPKLLEFAKQALAKYHKNDKDIFQTFFDDDFRFYGNNKRKESAIQGQKATFNLKFRDIKNTFPVLTEYANGITDAPYPYLTFIEFFNGKWLEDLILYYLQSVKEEYPDLGITEIKKGIKASFDQRLTEIDVIAVRGYQLFLFSCTTSQGITEVKQKAFEAIYRADELGGEHAKVIVVSPMYHAPVKTGRPGLITFTNEQENTLYHLAKDLQQFEAQRNCSLIGIDDLERGLQEERVILEKLFTIIKEGRADIS